MAHAGRRLKNRKGGNDPGFACFTVRTRLASVLVVPALSLWITALQPVCREHTGSNYQPMNKKEPSMTRFKITRNNNHERKQLLQAKLDASLVADVNLMCQWSGNEKTVVIAELLRYALSQEVDFQQYKKSLPAEHAPAITEAPKKEAASDKRTAPALAVAK